MDYALLGALALGFGLIAWQAHRYEQARLRDLGRLCLLLSNLAEAVQGIAEPAGRFGTHAMQPGDGRALLRERMAERAARRQRGAS